MTEMSPLTQVNGFRNNFVIKEYFHKMFNCTNRLEAKEFLCECYEWAYQIKATQIMKTMGVTYNSLKWNLPPLHHVFTLLIFQFEQLGQLKA